MRIVDAQNAGERKAVLRDVIKGDLAVGTGSQSRAELLFQDNTLTRLGADTLFSFTAGTRDISLGQGTMLLQVPKNLGGARIRTAAVTAAITGTTIMIENKPGSHVKVLVLEGSLRLSNNARFGESVVLTAGQMIIMGAKQTRMPQAAFRGSRDNRENILPHRSAEIWRTGPRRRSCLCRASD